MVRSWIAAGAAAIALATPASAQGDANIVTCALQQAGEEFKGTCAIPCRVNNLLINIDGPNMARACDTPPRQVQASIRKTERANHWLGTMTGKEPEDPTHFEMLTGANGATGVAKLPYGWFELATPKIEGQSMSLTINANKQLPPTPDDIRIVQRALSLVSSTDVWNKQDNRQCPPNPQKWSVFCAMMQATEEVSGGIHYRQPALQKLREAVNEVGGSRVDKHRIMDYNNHPDTTLADIHNLLRLTEKKLQERFK